MGVNGVGKVFQHNLSLPFIFLCQLIHFHSKFLEDNLRLNETLESERLHRYYNFSNLANANDSDSGWSPKL